MRIGRITSGFVLVEIAIVLALVSVILVSTAHVDGVIEQARVKSLARDLEQIQSAVRSYKGRYGALPGDDPRAASRWPGTPAGDGNGVLSVPSSVQPQYSNGVSGLAETSLFWLHLRLAGFIPGDPALSGATHPPILAGSASLGLQAGAVGHLGIALCLGNVRGAMAEVLDLRLDDGQPAAGVVRAGSTLRSASVQYSATATYTVCTAMSELRGDATSEAPNLPLYPQASATAPDQLGAGAGPSSAKQQGGNPSALPGAARENESLPGSRGNPPGHSNAADTAPGHSGAAPGQDR